MEELVAAADAHQARFAKLTAGVEILVPELSTLVPGAGAFLLPEAQTGGCSVANIPKSEEVKDESLIKKCGIEYLCAVRAYRSDRVFVPVTKRGPGHFVPGMIFLPRGLALALRDDKSRREISGVLESVFDAVDVNVLAAASSQRWARFDAGEKAEIRERAIEHASARSADTTLSAERRESFASEIPIHTQYRDAFRILDADREKPLVDRRFFEIMRACVRVCICESAIAFAKYIDDAVAGHGDEVLRDFFEAMTWVDAASHELSDRGVLESFPAWTRAWEIWSGFFGSSPTALKEELHECGVLRRALDEKAAATSAAAAEIAELEAKVADLAATLARLTKK